MIDGRIQPIPSDGNVPWPTQGFSIARYTTRHSFATMMIDNGVILRELQAALGHASSITTDRAYIGARKHIDTSVTSAINNVLKLKKSHCK